MNSRGSFQLYKIVTASGAKPFWLTVCLCAMTSVFEALGVFSVMPFMAAISNPNFLDQLRNAPAIGAQAANMKDSELIFGLGCLVVGITWSVSAVSAFSNIRLLKFSYNQEKILSVLLLQRYLSLPYQAYSTQDPSELGKNVLHETHRLTHGVLVPWINLISRLLSGLALIMLLLLVNWEVSLICGFAIGSVYLFVFRVVRAPLKKFGETSTVANTNRHQVVAEALSGIKEVQHYGLEARFLSLFSEQASAYVYALTRCDTVALLPRYIFEAVLVSIVIGATLVASRSGTIISQLPEISVFALAAYRLMPLFQQIFNGFAVIRFNKPSVEILEGQSLDLGKVCEKNGSEEIENLKLISGDISIHLQNVTYSYPSTNVTAISGVSLVLPKTGLICISGKSGSGKSTLLDLLAGSILPSVGAIFVNGHKFDQKVLDLWRSSVGLASQNAPLFIGTVRDNVTLWGLRQEEDAVLFEKCMAMAAMDPLFLQEDGPLVIGAGGRSVSGGQRQRISIARALYSRPKLLMLDEPTSALDRASAQHIIRELTTISKSIPVIVVSHDLNLAKTADKVIFVNDGVVEGVDTFAGLVATNGSFAEIWANKN